MFSRSHLIIGFLGIATAATAVTAIRAQLSTACGDGYKSSWEQCDDGNARNDDGCSASCTIEDGFRCTPDNAGRSACTVIIPSLSGQQTVSSSSANNAPPSTIIGGLDPGVNCTDLVTGFACDSRDFNSYNSIRIYDGPLTPDNPTLSATLADEFGDATTAASCGGIGNHRFQTSFAGLPGLSNGQHTIYYYAMSRFNQPPKLLGTLTCTKGQSGGTGTSSAVPAQSSSAPAYNYICNGQPSAVPCSSAAPLSSSSTPVSSSPIVVASSAPASSAASAAVTLRSIRVSCQDIVVDYAKRNEGCALLKRNSDMFAIGHLCGNGTGPIDGLVTVPRAGFVPNLFPRPGATVLVCNGTDCSSAVTVTGTTCTNDQAHLSLQLSAPQTIQRGENLTYTITARNEGPSALRTATTVFVVPMYYTFLPSASSDACFLNNNRIFCRISSALAKDASRTFTMSFSGPTGAPSGTQDIILRNVARLSESDPPNPTTMPDTSNEVSVTVRPATSSSSSSPTSSPTSTSSTPPTSISSSPPTSSSSLPPTSSASGPTTDVQLTEFTGPPAEVRQGMPLTYTAVIRNLGSPALQTAIVGFGVPQYYVFNAGASTAGCTVQMASQIHCALQSPVFSGQTRSYTVSFDGPNNLPAFIDDYAVINAANVRFTSPTDATPFNNTSTVLTTTILGPDSPFSPPTSSAASSTTDRARVVLQLSAPASIQRGAPLRYSLTVNNFGPEALRTATIALNIPTYYAFSPSASTGCAAATDGPRVLCRIPSAIAKFDEHTFTVAFDGPTNVPAAVRDIVLSNTATRRESSPPDPFPNGATASTTVTVVDPPPASSSLASSSSAAPAATTDVQMSIGGPPSAKRNERISYGAVLTNTGPLTLQSANVRIGIPAYYSFNALFSTPGCTAGTYFVTCVLQNPVPSGETRNFFASFNGPTNLPTTISRDFVVHSNAIAENTTPGDASPYNNESAVVGTTIIGPRECEDGKDNDGDGRIDWNTPGNNDPGCPSADDDNESDEPLCNNLKDDDGDGKIDLNDAGCQGQGDDNEASSPLGSLDVNISNDQVIKGWSCDQDRTALSNKVHFYDGQVGLEGSIFLGSGSANIPREAAVGDACLNGLFRAGDIKNNNHGYVFNLPASIRDGKRHAIYAYGINLGGAADNTKLPGSPKIFPAAECADGLDNDRDGKKDFTPPSGSTADDGCTSATDTTEFTPPVTECNDGIDNDGNGKADFSGANGLPADSGCFSALDKIEAAPSTPPPPPPPPAALCNDDIDNDLDGTKDFPNDVGCSSLTDNTEMNQCWDGVDNDGDGSADFGNDIGCSNAFDNDETNSPIPTGMYHATCNRVYGFACDPDAATSQINVRLTYFQEKKPRTNPKTTTSRIFLGTTRADRNVEPQFVPYVQQLCGNTATAHGFSFDVNHRALSLNSYYEGPPNATITPDKSDLYIEAEGVDSAGGQNGKLRTLFTGSIFGPPFLLCDRP